MMNEINCMHLCIVFFIRGLKHFNDKYDIYI